MTAEYNFYTVPHDPLLLVVNAYIAERDRYNAARDPANETEEFLDFVLMSELSRILMEDTPVCRSDEGAQAALRLVAEHLTECVGSFEAPLLRSAMTYLMGREANLCEYPVRGAIEGPTLH